MDSRVVLFLVILLLFVWFVSMGSQDFYSEPELQDARLLSFALHKDKESIPSDCDIPVPSGYITQPLVFNLQKQQGKGWAVYLVELSFNIQGQKTVFKALLDTGSDHLVLLGKECDCSTIYKLYPPIGQTTPP